MAKTESITLSRRESSLRERLVDEIRSITLGPYNPKDRELARIFGGRDASSGVVVNEHTAMAYSAVWAAVNLISSHIAIVPLNLYRREGEGKVRFDKHPTHRLIHDRPNPQMGSAVFRRTLQAHALVWGNGYAEIERDAASRPVALWPLLPQAVQPFIEGGQLRYRVYNPSGTTVVLDAQDVIHIRGIGDDGICGHSVISKAREAIGLGIAAERFGATFFGNGATFGGVISYPQGVGSNPQTRKENREAIEQRHQGVDRAHRLLALYGGAKYERMGIPPNDAQFLETRQFQIEEICRWFNVPPHKIKHLERSTNNNIEHQGIEYVTDTLDPWWVIWEEELSMKLIPTLERGIQMIEHVREGLLRGDAAARGDFYSKLFSIGAITPNEIRQRENLNPVKGGDTVYVPLNTLPLDRLEEYIDATLKQKEQPKQPPPQQPDPAQVKQDEEQKAKHEAELADARKKAQEWEDRHDLLLAALGLEQEQHKAAVAKRDEAAATIAQLDGVVAEFGERFTEMAGKLDAVTAQRDMSTQEAADLTIAYRFAQADLESWASQANEHQARATQLAGELATCEGERDAARAEVEAGMAKLADAIASAAQMAAERDEQMAARQADADASKAYAEAAEAREHALAEERDGLIASLNAEKVATEAQKALVLAEQEKQRTQRAAVLAAMRSLFVDASERLLQKEMDRARKHQSTPDKLRAWLEGFYPLHEDTVRAAFLPLVGPWTAVSGGVPSVLLDKLVAEHIEASTKALRQVLDSDDPEQMAANLERTLRRWESERADAMADALVREGMAR